MLVSIFALLFAISVKFVTCGTLYEAEERLGASAKYVILSREEKPSKLSCLHVCRVKHRDTSTAVWFDSGQCKCLQENNVDGEEIVGQHFIAKEIPKAFFFMRHKGCSGDVE